ncbi:hypothetical protein C0Q70_06645 [Pomacea canaliculata]|uniref:Amine oxidase domain-containing protein n=1 Tax=Pomacea canaliculata TaxID=400727 RepID=A0A2T7PCT9_POMCA|nr:all-trans-retinol 13,14-reductase-like [Pomacea canaliculata]XP_025089541.1 all-trans-retinol 13,14-reductase-like [Pomacea canaliculata]PVD31233.1 hypothetical protein C0Q70_06645 [Pomacea canaliculata]
MAVERFLDYLAENPRWIAFGLAGYTTLYLITRMLSGPRAGRNPFATDSRKPREPLVTDPHARDAVLKQRFKQNKVPDNLDAIVIGSGAGGLTAAILLAKAGKRVVVVEQHDQAGGCCHTFEEKGFEFDTGIHYIGDMENSTSRQLLDQITDGQLDWICTDQIFDTVATGDPENVKLFPMKTGKDDYFLQLIKFFPEEKESIMKYKQLILDASKSFFGLVALKMMPMRLALLLLKTGLARLFFSFSKYTSVTLQETLDSLTANKELHLVLSYIGGDYGALPKDTPFLLHALLIKHYLNGSYYPIGGPSEISFQMIQAIERLGGKVFVQAPVTEIIISPQGRAVGVKVGKSSGSVAIYAKTIISDAGVINTFKHLLPREVAKKSCIYPVIDAVGPSLSFVSTFIGVDGSQSQLQLPSGNIWYYKHNDINKSVDEYLSLGVDDITTASAPLYFISFPSAKDPTWEQRHSGKSAVLVITLARWEWFKQWENERLRHRGQDYEDIKEALGLQMWRLCCNLFPQLDGKKEYMEVGTPVTNKYYLAASSGEMYGLDHGKNRFSPETFAALRSDTGIPGLFLTGQDILSCGFTSVLYAGLFCASSILHRNLLNDLNALDKSLKKSQ